MASAVKSNGTLPPLSQSAGTPVMDGHIVSGGPLGGIPFEVWDISETISQLSYLTHNHFRYYGKFPSTLAAGFLNRFTQPGDRILDNYCGSGTTLVEALLRGQFSVGVDINPFAVLASKVKTTLYNTELIMLESSTLIEKCERFLSEECEVADKEQLLWKAEHCDRVSLSDPSADKWFDKVVQHDLYILRDLISDIADDSIRPFFWCAYFAIIRRVSRAYDGEVRPHINKTKRQRSVKSAFVKKVRDMLSRAIDLGEAVSPGRHSDEPLSVAIQADNRELLSCDGISDLLFDAALSHPPYLNCFDYLPVYKLEFMWGEGVSGICDEGEYKRLRSEAEIRAWPATSESMRAQYFEDQRRVYQAAHALLRPGATLGVVIGDATVKKQLVRVHEILAKVLMESGYSVEKIVYRTTHYGTGKYSYEHRADYHSSDEQEHWSNLDADAGKRDAIIIARRD